MDGSEPFRVEPNVRPPGPQERRIRDADRLGTGTLACPECDAPVGIGEARLRASDPLACSFCGHAGALREFLSLSTPARPARVAVRVVPRAA
jgi:hypothetical protein